METDTPSSEGGGKVPQDRQKDDEGSWFRTSKEMSSLPFVSMIAPGPSSTLIHFTRSHSLAARLTHWVPSTVFCGRHGVIPSVRATSAPFGRRGPLPTGALDSGLERGRFSSNCR